MKPSSWNKLVLTLAGRPSLSHAPRRRRNVTATRARFVARALVCHVSTYFVAGALALWLLDYDALFRSPGVAGFMRPLDSPWVAAGPALQSLRGLLLGLALGPIWPAIRDARRGWLILWGLLVALSVLGPSGAAPGSLEGLIYTTLPPAMHLRGMPEVLAQTLAFAWLMDRWDRGLPRWASRLLGVTASLAVVASVLGVLDALGVLPRT